MYSKSPRYIVTCAQTLSARAKMRTSDCHWPFPDRYFANPFQPPHYLRSSRASFGGGRASNFRKYPTQHVYSRSRARIKLYIKATVLVDNCPSILYFTAISLWLPLLALDLHSVVPFPLVLTPRLKKNFTKLPVLTMTR